MEIDNRGLFLVRDFTPDEIFTIEEINKEDQMIAKTAKDFRSKEVDTIMVDLDENLDYDRLKKLVKKAAEIGLCGMDVPERFGGMGLGYITSLSCIEQLHRGSSQFIMAYGMSTGLGMQPIFYFGSNELKAKYLEKLASCELIGTYALTEPNHGSDALGAETTAELSEDGKYYILNGQKVFSTNAGCSDVINTYAQLDGKFTAFVVENSFEGITLDAEEEKMGLHGSSTRGINFNNVKVPVENLLGEIGEGHKVALYSLNAGRLKVGAGMIGFSKAVIAETVRYAKERVQFGVPIFDFGLIKYKIAEMVIRTYILESMVYRTGNSIDLITENIDYDSDTAGMEKAQILNGYAIEGSIAKVFGSECIDYCCDEGVQIYGGYGYIKGEAIERWYRDQRIIRIYEGTNEINRLLIANTIVKEGITQKIPLFEKIAEIMEEAKNGSIATDDSPAGFPEKQLNMLKKAKKAALIAIGLAVEKYGKGLQGEQQLLAMIADNAIDVFGMESGLLRAIKARKTVKKKDLAGRHELVMSVFCNDVFPKVLSRSRQAIAVLFDEDPVEAEKWNTVIRSLDEKTDVNAAKLRTEIASIVKPISRTPFGLS